MKNGKNPDAVRTGPYREPGETEDVRIAREAVELRSGLDRHKVALREARDQAHDQKRRANLAEGREAVLEEVLKKERKRRGRADLGVALVAALSVGPLSWCFDVAPRHGAGYTIAALVAWLSFWRIRWA